MAEICVLRSDLGFLSCFAHPAMSIAAKDQIVRKLPATVTGLRILLLILCQVKNTEHIGDPTSNMGISSATRFRARSLMTTSSTSHSLPWVSAVVKSKLNPGMILSSGKSFVAAVTRGGESISDTAARIAFRRSCWYWFEQPPNALTTTRIS